MQSCPRPCDHEVDDFRRDFFGRADEIALVFAVFGIHRDDDLAATHGVDGCLDTRQSLRHALLVLKSRARTTVKRRLS